MKANKKKTVTVIYNDSGELHDLSRKRENKKNKNGPFKQH